MYISKYVIDIRIKVKKDAEFVKVCPHLRKNAFAKIDLAAETAADFTTIQREQTDKFKTPTAAVFAMIFVLIVQMILGSCHLVTLFVCVASIWRAGSRPDFKNWTQSKAAAIAIQEQQLRFGSF